MTAQLEYVAVIDIMSSPDKFIWKLALRGRFAEAGGVRRTPCDLTVQGADCHLSFDLSERDAWIAPFMRSLAHFGPRGPSLDLALVGGTTEKSGTKIWAMNEAVVRLRATEEAGLREVVAFLAEAIENYEYDGDDLRFAYAVKLLHNASGERRRRVSSGRTSAIAARGALAEHSLLFVTELYRHGGSWEHIQVASAKPERAEARQWALKLFCSLGDVGLEFRERDNPGLFSKWAAFSADEHGGYLRLTMLSEGVAVENGTWAEIDRALRGQIHSIVDQLSEGLSEAKILIETMSREEIAFWALNAELVKRGLDKAKEVIGSG